MGRYYSGNRRYPNQGKWWNKSEKGALIAMFYGGCDIRYISTKLGRTQVACMYMIEKMTGCDYDW